MEIKTINLVITLIRVLFALFLGSSLVSACPSPLECANFTQSEKVSDCNYLTSQSLSNQEEQEVLCILWDQNYASQSFTSPQYPPLNPDFTFNYNEIDTGSFILAFKILTFILFNYFVYSVLTKPSWVRKWLG